MKECPICSNPQFTYDDLRVFIAMGYAGPMCQCTITAATQPSNPTILSNKSERHLLTDKKGTN